MSRAGTYHFLIYNSFGEVEAIDGSVRREGTQGWIERNRRLAEGAIFLFWELKVHAALRGVSFLRSG